MSLIAGGLFLLKLGCFRHTKDATGYIFCLCPVQMRQRAVDVDPLAYSCIWLAAQFFIPEFSLAHKDQRHTTYRCVSGGPAWQAGSHSADKLGLLCSHIKMVSGTFLINIFQ